MQKSKILASTILRHNALVTRAWSLPYNQKIFWLHYPKINPSNFVLAWDSLEKRAWSKGSHTKCFFGKTIKYRGVERLNSKNRQRGRASLRVLYWAGFHCGQLWLNSTGGLLYISVVCVPALSAYYTEKENIFCLSFPSDISLTKS